MIDKVLGKITSAEFGQDKDFPFLFGLHLSFRTPDFGVDDGGRYTVNISKECKWDKPEDRNKAIVSNVEKINKILEDAKCSYVSELKNKPVELVIQDNYFKSFRILTEVL